jgi:hypothetical protein
MYYKEILDERDVEKQEKKNKFTKKIILTLFIKHNHNTLEMKMGFINMNHTEIESHLQSVKTRLKVADFSDSIVKEVP